MTDVIVRPKHVRAARMCMSGARSWFSLHGLSWSEFLTNGTPASVILSKGCPLGDRAVEAARQDPDGQ